MAERWQTSEARVAAVFFRDASGNPVTGLSPTATSDYKDGTAGAPGVTVVEVGNGFYRCTFASAPTKDVLVRVDGGGSLTTSRYVALEVPVGGYVDSVDATVSSRASQASVTALGSPAQAADYTSARAAKLDNLDATVSSRASASALTTAQTDLTTLTGRLTSTRATLLDALSLLDAAVSGRASASDMTTVLGRLTAARALLLDQLDGALADPIARVSDLDGLGGGSTSYHADIT